jgi:ABC-2 type transport system permease protein
MSDPSLALTLPPGPSSLPAGPPHGRAAAWSDARTMITRSLRMSLRNVDGLITALALPVILMLMFVYLFGGAIHTGTRYIDYVVPGVLLVCVGWGAGNTAVGVAHDLTTGIIDRFRSMDVRSEALINGHVAASVARNLLSTGLVFAVAFAIGFRSEAGLAAWLGAAGILTVFILALSWLAAAIGITARSAEAATGMTFLISFLAYPSSAFVPVRTMPTWLQGFAENQPVTKVIDTIRSLLGGTPAGASAWYALAWSLGIIAGSILLAGVLFQRRTR